MRRILGWLLAPLALTVLAFPQQLDPTFLALRQRIDPPLRWDNVEGAPDWVAGQSPRYRAESGWHWVTLSPGGETVVRLAAGGTLRLVGWQGPLRPSDVEIWLSSGSPLWLEEPAGIAAGSASLLVTPRFAGETLVRIVCPAGRKKDLPLALFISRREARPLDLPEFALLPDLPGATAVLRYENSRGEESYHLSGGDHDFGLDVSGPVLLMIKVRYQFGPDDTDPQGKMWLRCRIDDRPVEPIQLSSRLEERPPLRVNGVVQAVGGAAYAFLSIPAGPHRLGVHANAPFYFRVLGFRGKKPEIDSQISDWTRAEKRAFSLARDPGLREGGVAAARELLEPARQGGDRWLESLGRVFLREQTEYRSLYPEHLSRGSRSLPAAFVVPAIVSPNPGEAEVAASPRFAGLGAGGVVKGVFFRLDAASTGDGPELRFTLPEHATATWIRLAVLQEGEVADRTLRVCFDNGLERRVFQQRVSDFPLPPEMVANKAFIGPWAGLAMDSPLLAASVIELEVPPTARTLTISSLSPAARSVAIAVQQRLSLPWQLHETQYLDALSQLRPDFRQLFAAPPAPAGSPEASFLWTALRAHGDLCRRLLESLSAQFGTRSGTPPNRSLQSTGVAGSEEERRLLARARQAEAGTEWHTALEVWNELLYCGGSAVRPDALLGRVRALEGLQEGFLSRQQLKAIVLWEPDPALVEQAADRYRQQISRSEDRFERELELDATLVLLDPKVERIHRLCAGLLAADRAEHALLVGFPFCVPPPESVLIAALHERRYHLLPRLLEMLPEGERHLWIGLRSANEGDFDQARKSLLKAGSAGQAWLKHLDEGLAISKALAAPTGDRAAVASSWQEWPQGNPGPRVWREIDRGAIAGGGWDLFYHSRSNTYSHFARATRQQPFQAEITGLRRWKIRVYPHFPVEKPFLALNDWAEVEIDGQVRNLPITHNQPNPDLGRVGAEAFQLGDREEMVFSTGPGRHRLRIIPGATPLAVQLFEEQPLISLPVLPSPGADAARMLLASDYGGSVPHSPPPGETVRDQMARWVREAEENPLEFSGKVGQAASYYFRHRDQADLEPLFQRLRAGSVWSPLGGAVKSAGFWVTQSAPIRPTVPLSRARQALLPLASSGTRLESGEKLRAAFYLPVAARELTIQAVLEVPDYLDPIPCQLLATLDGKGVGALALAEANSSQQTSLQIPAGRHVLEIATDRPVPGQTIRVILLERGPGKGWREVAFDRSLTFDAAVPGSPLVFPVAGPAWLRVDRYDQSRGTLLHEDRLIDDPRGELRIEPATSGYGFRVFQRLFAPFALRAAVTDPPTEPRPWAHPATRPVAGPPVLRDAYPLGGQEDGTWSVSLVSRTDHFLEEEESATSPFSHRLDLSLVKRKYLAARGLYWRGELTLRPQTHGLGSLRFFLHRPARERSLAWDVESSWYLQDSSAIPGGPRVTSALFLAGRMTWRQVIARGLTNQPGVRLFLRFLADPLPLASACEELDLDVYSRYKTEHRYGFTLEDRLVLATTPRSRLWMAASLTANEFWGELRPDSLQWEAGGDLRVGWLNLSLAYRLRRYLSDDDRSHSFSRHVVSAGFSWDHWQKNQQRWEWGGRFHHDLSRNASSFAVFLAWHGGRGRGWRDFSPRETVFRDDRQRLLERAGATNNNGMGE